jgi:hypothetical protein
MGIQVASDRYTHRVDSIVIRKPAFWLHFSPHLIAILFAVLMMSVGRFLSIDFFIFICFISASLLSIFAFLQWLLKTLSPEMMISTSLDQIDSDFVNEVEESIRVEREEIFENGDRDPILNIFREIAYLEVSDDDPVDRSMDIIRSRILNNDTGTAKTLIEEYSNHTESIIEDTYKEFITSHSDSQLVYWYLLGPIEDLFQLAVKEENHRVAQDIISLQRKSIEGWFKKDIDGVPEVFFRVFNSISIEYLTHCNYDHSIGVARQYGKIGRLIASDINSSEMMISGANQSNFVTSCMAYAERSIRQDFIKSATLIRSTLRFIVDARLQNPPSDPSREILMVGLIGELFASEDAVSRDIVEIANETSVRNEAEWTITTLITFKDKIEEQGKNQRNDEILQKVFNEIERVNLALEESDRDVASNIPYDEDLVLSVIRGSRLFRSPFSVKELIEEIEMPESIEREEVENICISLERSGVLEDRGEDGFMKSTA